MKAVKHILPLLLVFAMQNAVAQTNMHLVNFDKRLLHYGIGLGVTDIKFDLPLAQDDGIRSTMRGVESYYAPGFHLYIIGDMRLTSFMNLRLIPGITLVERNLHYNWDPDALAADHRLDEQRNVETVFADVPLELKIRTWRWRNFRPYLVGGGQVFLRFCIAEKQQKQGRPVDSAYKNLRIQLHSGGGIRFLPALFQTRHRAENELRHHRPKNSRRQLLHHRHQRHEHTRFSFNNNRRRLIHNEKHHQPHALARAAVC